MSKLETNTIDTISGTTNLTIGSTNSSTVTFENGAVTGHMTPYFCAVLGTQVTGQADATWFKLTFDNYAINEGSDFDTTNDKFVVSKAGKYYFNIHFSGGTSSASSVGNFSTALYKNGTRLDETMNTQKLESEVELSTANTQSILDLVVGDYIEAYGYIDRTTGTSRNTKNQFVGFRLGA